MSSPASSALTPFARFDLVTLLRKDVLGETWRALNLQDGCKVDLRFLPAWTDLLWMREWAQYLQQLNHTGLIAVAGIEANESQAAVVMEMCDGETITARRYRRPSRHFEVSEIKPWLRALHEVLAYLHGCGVAHGALHLGTCFVESGSLRVADLAVSRILRPQPHLDGAGGLPPGSLSPQALNGEPPSSADDIYAIGALAYDLLTGSPVFHSGDIASQVRSTVPPAVEQRRMQLAVAGAPMPKPWEDWIAAALAKDPQRRPSLDDLRDLLASGTFAKPGEPAVKASSEGSAPERSVPRSSLASKRALVLSTAGAAAAVAVGTGLYLGVIAPKKVFRTALDADFNQALAFDQKTAADHQAVIQRWSKFENNWSPKVESRYPVFQTVLAAAREYQSRRAASQQLAEEAARQDRADRERAYASRARTEFEAAKARAAASGSATAAIEAWRGFIASYEKDFEGAPVPEIASEVSSARTELSALEKAAELEQKKVNEGTATIKEQAAALRSTLTDAALPAAIKVTKIQDFLGKVAQLPRTAAALPEIEQLRSEMHAQLAPLQAQAQTLAASGPIPFDLLFSDTAAANFSVGGRKRILGDAQSRLKEQGFYTGPADGGQGQESHEAILAFQTAKGLFSSGFLDAGTLNALGLVNLADQTELPAVADSTPQLADAKPARSRKSSSRTKEAKPEPSLLDKGVSGVKNVGKSIGNFFKGDKK